MRRLFILLILFFLFQMIPAKAEISSNKIKVIVSTETTINFFDFSEFTKEIGSYNVEYLERRLYGNIDFGLGIQIGHFFTIGSIHIVSCGASTYDSIKMKSNLNQYGLEIGYNLIDTKRILFSPRTKLILSRVHLINSSKEDPITFDQYMLNRDLDLLFYQITSLIGCELSYKSYELHGVLNDYMTLGITVDYVTRINKSPWIYSKGNRLISDKSLGVNNVQFGVVFRMVF